ncbi:MAG: PQQ-binding-like beta-propeller repeat protein [Planctomycetes bacterium]|nr:PQQ-binding-like beta-propeller repeat protein [Planctomycetota bacterium]
MFTTRKVLPTLALGAMLMAACTASTPKKEGEVENPKPEKTGEHNTPAPAKKLTLSLDDLKAYEIKDGDAGKPIEFKLENGMTGWAVKMPQQLPMATPAVSDGRLFVGGGFGSYDFYCIDAETGKMIWQVRTTDDGPTGAVVSGDYVAYNTESCTLEIRLCSNGELVWGRWLGDPLMSQPAIADGRVLMCWPTGGGFGNATPALPPEEQHPEDEIAPDKDGDPVPQTADQPKAVETSSGAGAVKRGTIAQGGITVKGEGSHAIGCFDLKSGKVYWAQAVPGDCISAPVVEGGIVFASTLDGTLTQIDLKTGELLGQKKQNATSAPWVAVEDGKPEAICAQRETETTVVDGKEVQVHYEGWRRFDRGSHAQGDIQQRQSADYLDRRVVAENAYYGSASKSAQDSGVGFGSAPSTAKAGDAEQNVGEGSIVGLWAFQGSRPLVHKGKLYNCLGNTVSGGDTAGDKVEWELTYRPDRKERLLSPPAAAGGQLIFAGLDGAVFSVDSESGELTHAMKLNKSFVFQPAVMDGKIYLCTQDGWLIAIDTGDEALSGWSMWGGGPAHNGK